MIFARIMVGLAAEAADSKTFMINSTYVRSHRTARGMRAKKGWRGRQIGRTKGRVNTKVDAVTDAEGRTIPLFMGAGQRRHGWRRHPWTA